MKEMVTITRVGDAIRLSRVTAHGEELILDPDLEARSLAVLLWAMLAKEDPLGGQTLVPWHRLEAGLNKLTAGLEKIGTQVEKLAHELNETKKAAAKPTPVRVGQ